MRKFLSMFLLVVFAIFVAGSLEHFFWIFRPSPLLEHFFSEPYPGNYYRAIASAIFFLIAVIFLVQVINFISSKNKH